MIQETLQQPYECSVTDKKSHNFGLALPEHLAEQADEMIKSSYRLEFLGSPFPDFEKSLDTRDYRPKKKITPKQAPYLTV